jgi:hypothetical protein
MTAINTYDYGQVVKISVNVQVDDVDTDPGSLVFEIRAGGGTVTQYAYPTDAQVVKDSVGDYHVLWTIASEQIHYYRWQNASGAAQGAGESHFKVRDSAFN